MTKQKDTICWRIFSIFLKLIPANTSKFQILGEIILTLFIASSLYLSRNITFFLILFLLGFTTLVFIVIQTRSPFALLLLSNVTALSLALRIPSLPWGDPWQDYAMIIRTLNIGYPDFWIPHEDSLHALISQPLMPALLAFLCWMTKIDPIIVQKVVVPIVGATAPLILWSIAKEYVSRSAALYCALLFLVSAPFVHWLTQPVREAVAIPILFLTLWSGDQYVKAHQNRYLITLTGCILILTPLHTFSALIFLISWFGYSIGKIIIIEDQVEKENKGRYYWGIFIGSFIYSISWLFWFNFPIKQIILDKSSSIFPIINNSPILFVFICLCFISVFFGFATYLEKLPYISNSHPRIHQTCKKRITLFLQISGLLGVIISILFISGYSSFKINYPISLLIPPIIILLLVIIGLPKIITKECVPIIFWLTILGFYYLYSMTNPSEVQDPLRTLGYLFAPLCFISGVGVEFILNLFQNPVAKKILIIGLSVFCTTNLIFTFPAPIFLGFTPEPGQFLYDERQYIISHPESEIEGIKWLSKNYKTGTIYTDTNIYYASLWITQNDQLKTEKNPDRLNPNQFKSTENSYILISDRMLKYAKFGEWLLEKSKPLSNIEYQQVETNTTRIYKKDNFEIFLHPSQNLL